MQNSNEGKKLFNFLTKEFNIDSKIYVSGILGCGATFDNTCIKSIPSELYVDGDKDIIEMDRNSFSASPMNKLFVTGSLIEQILKLGNNFASIEKSNNLIDRHNAYIRNSKYNDKKCNVVQSFDGKSIFIHGFVIDDNNKIIACEDFGFTSNLYSYLDQFADENNFAPLVTMLKDGNGNVIYMSPLHNYRNDFKVQFQVSKLSKLIKIYTEWYSQFDRKFRNDNMSYENAIMFATQILMYSKYLIAIQDKAFLNYSIDFNGKKGTYPSKGVITDYVGVAAYWTYLFNEAKNFKINGEEIFKPYEQVNDIVEYFKTYDKNCISDIITDAQTIAFNSLTNRICSNQINNNKTYIKRNNH